MWENGRVRLPHSAPRPLWWSLPACPQVLHEKAQLDRELLLPFLRVSVCQGINPNSSSKASSLLLLLLPVLRWS